MIHPMSVAASQPPATRKSLAIEVLSKAEPISHLAAQHQVSRKFLYQQRQKAREALDAAFSSITDEPDVLFHLPISKTWLWQLILGLVLICHCSYRGVVELLRDLFDLPISVGTIHNRLQSAAEKASAINLAQDLSAIKVGLHDEIFQGNQPVLVGVDAESTYCYLLAAAEQRDEDTWGVHLLDASQQGLNLDYTIADAAKGLRAGQAAAWPETPCHGDIFHIQHQGKGLVNFLSRQAVAANSQRQKLEQEMQKAKQQGRGNTLSTKLTLARQAEDQALQLANDIKSLVQWLNHDILALAGPSWEERQGLFDFIVAELSRRESLVAHRIRPLRVALKHQRDDLLAFAAVLDQKLADIAQRFGTPLYLVRAICLLHRKKPSACAYWQCWNHLHHQLKAKFHLLMKAVTEAMKQTPRASSLVENLNSRLRNYFFLRRQLGPQYLNLLRFFLNHRRLIRSECPERVGKSPTEIMTGQPHAHWLELLGFERFQRV
ncbi:MAG: hypothetical protein JO235_10940 [Chroococcidiopsidaceae cyanobacterium CP_BM_RX_35]|nr:hypothetical protein [Chroococcidiopsidaceae cyanobacterium CP_BM_RX_35]